MPILRSRVSTVRMTALTYKTGMNTFNTEIYRLK
jgi:hypothetical protein